MSLHAVVVEDNPAVLDLVVEVLDEAGYRVTAAPSLASARRALAAGPVDVVVADVGLGGADGRTLADAVDARGETPALVLMSGYGRETAGVGSARFLEKPFAPTELLASIAAALS